MKVWLNWSGGKDSAFSLYKAQSEGLAVEALVTTINKKTNCIAMHGVRRSLLEQQAIAMDIPLYTVEMTEFPDMEVYENAISVHNRILKEKGFTHVISGDIFLEDLRSYRSALYAKEGINCLYPIWKMDSKKLLAAFFEAGFKAIVVAVDGSILDESFCGRMLDRDFIHDLPPGADACGENGEYHSFVFDGPVFKSPVAFTKGSFFYQELPKPKIMGVQSQAAHSRTGFYFCDLLPG